MPVMVHGGPIQPAPTALPTTTQPVTGPASSPVSGGQPSSLTGPPAAAARSRAKADSPASASPPPTPAAPPRSPAPKGYPESVTRLIDELARLPGIGRRSAERLAFHILKTPAAEALGLARAVQDVKERVRHCRICFNLADLPGLGSGAGTPAPATRANGTVCSICAAAWGAGVAASGNSDGTTVVSAISETERQTLGGSESGREERRESPARDGSLVMVVEQPKDLLALEQTAMYQGVYHVLMGRIAPLEGVSAGDLTISSLLERIDTPSLNAGGVRVREVILALNPTLEGDGTALYLSEQIAQRAVKVTRLARGLPTGSQLEYANKAVLADAIQGRRSV